MADRLRLLCAGQQARSWPSALSLGPTALSATPPLRHSGHSSRRPFVTSTIRRFVRSSLRSLVSPSDARRTSLAASLRLCGGGRLLSDPLLLREIIDVTLNDRSVMRRGGLLQGRGKTPPGVVRPTGFAQQSAAGTGEQIVP